MEVWAYCEFDNCVGEDCQSGSGLSVIALYTSKQTAEQHRDREDAGYVVKIEVNTKLRSF